MEKKATAYLSWVDDILKQLQRWSDIIPGKRRETERSILKRVKDLSQALGRIKKIFQQDKNRVYEMIEEQEP